MAIAHQLPTMFRQKQPNLLMLKYKLLRIFMQRLAAETSLFQPLYPSLSFRSGLHTTLEACQNINTR